MTIAHPIAHAWLTTGGRPGETTGAQNYDEFADDAEITAIIAANPTSALAIEMPHCAPESLGRSLRDALPDAVARLARAKTAGRYAEHGDIAVVYRIAEPDGTAGYGLWCMVDTDQISTSADEPGLVIRNEDVFLEKVRERVALAQALGHLLSPVLMLATGTANELHSALVDAVAGREAVATDLDQAGRRHELYPIPAGPTRDRLLALAGGAELVVADGNHRSLAAQMAAVSRFLAVVTTPQSVVIRPYHRLISELTVTTAELVDQLTARGAAVERLSTLPGVPARASVVHLYVGGQGFAVVLPRAAGAEAVDNLDHALVERVLLGDILALDPGDKRITYVGGDYPPKWLRGEVDAGRAALAVLIAPVTVDDFIAVNLARRKLPRKSTWFTPKARAGLVVAEIDG
jgi:uncharacterized protein (DUF1015 family)